MVVVGIVCLIMPSVVAGYLSIIIGALMTLVGGAGVAFRLAGRFEEKTRGAGTSFVMATLGVVCIFYGDVSTNIIGVSWGLLGLYKVAGEYDEVVAKARRRKLDAVQLLLATARTRAFPPAHRESLRQYGAPRRCSRYRANLISLQTASR